MKKSSLDERTSPRTASWALLDLSSVGQATVSSLYVVEETRVAFGSKISPTLTTLASTVVAVGPLLHPTVPGVGCSSSIGRVDRRVFAVGVFELVDVLPFAAERDLDL